MSRELAGYAAAAVLSAERCSSPRAPPSNPSAGLSPKKQPSFFTA